MDVNSKMLLISSFLKSTQVKKQAPKPQTSPAPNNTCYKWKRFFLLYYKRNQT